jgi:hypothetical protein
VDELTAHTSQVPGLEAKLQAGVKALEARAHAETQKAIDSIEAVLPEYIESEMKSQQQVTTDPEWIAAMAGYYGFPKRSMGDVTGTIVAWLNQEFGAMVRAAEEELVRNA